MNEELLNVCRLNQYDLNLHGLSTVGGIGFGPAPTPEEVKAIKFSSELPNSISLQKPSTMSVNMEYSYDGTNWTAWDFSALQFGGANGDLYIRGDNTSLAIDISSKYCSFKEGTGQTDYTVSGNIMYLLSHDGSRQLSEYAFTYLFDNCKHMTSAPELPAETLTRYCYYSLFNNCIKLAEIKCFATNIDASNSRYNWVRNVSSEGTFYKSKNVSWPEGTKGVPEGWTVINV